MTPATFSRIQRLVLASLAVTIVALLLVRLAAPGVLRTATTVVPAVAPVGDAPVAAGLVAEAVDPDRWEELGRSQRVYPTVCFNRVNPQSGTAAVAAILDVRETAAGPGGRRERHWLVRTDLHHPLVRIVDTLAVDSSSGAEQVVHRVSMAADHAVVSFPGGQLPEWLAGSGVTVKERLLGTDFYLLGFAATDVDTLPRVLEALRTSGDLVASADPDYINYTADVPEAPGEEVVPAVEAATDPVVAAAVSDLLGLPNDIYFGSLWGMRNTGQTGGSVAGMDINAVSAWNVRTDASSVVVGVIDTGIRNTHQDLAANMWMNPGETGVDAQRNSKATNGIDDDGNGYIDDVFGINSITNTGLKPGMVTDDHGHGTHCSGTIGGSGNNGVGVAGVCWKVQLMALKFLNQNGSGYDSDAVQCLAYARAKGAKLTSNSWGGGGFSTATFTAIQQARDADILFVAAAGNSGANNDVQPNYPCGYNVENVIAVAAMGPDGSRASFSCYGATTVDVAAPGVSTYSCGVASDTAYTTMSGTSMATPHVAGVVALMRAQLPTMNYAEIASRLFRTATVMAGWSGVVATGGRVDAGRAVSEALPQITPAAAIASGWRGASVQLSVAASDPLAGALSYQWRKGGVALAGATAATYTVASLQQTSVGLYDCLVTNGTGTVVAAATAITLRSGPDFDHNGSPDLLWTNTTTGRRVLWLMNGTAWMGNQVVELGTAATSWSISGTGDFDGNGSTDILWSQAGTGRRVIWLMNGTSWTGQIADLGVVSTDWVINGVGDFDGNGSVDIVWSQSSTGRRIVWLMSGATWTRQAAELGNVAIDWSINGAADFDGNGSPDLLWTQASTGRRIIWLMNGTTRLNVPAVELGTVPLVWRLDGTSDFDGDGWTDLIWTNTSTGRRIAWLMTGPNWLSSRLAELGTVPLFWTIGNH